MTSVDQPSEAPKEAPSEANPSSARVELARSAFYAGVVDPVRGLAQIAYHFAGTKIDATVRSAAESVALEPTQPTPVIP